MSAEQELAIRVRVNGVAREVTVPVRRLLSDALRYDLGLTGTHVGCEHGVCGACTVLLDGRPVRSCLLLAVGVDGHEVTTVEGLTRGLDQDAGRDGSQDVGRDDSHGDGSSHRDGLHPVQQAFAQCHALQCGFCTPGLLTTVAAYLDGNPDPTREQAREAISGNLCRCTGYQNITDAVLRAAQLSRRPARREDRLVDPSADPPGDQRVAR
ncbi:MAG: (2Fe-2S)-binding protein [Angustibacter sp.]